MAHKLRSKGQVIESSAHEINLCLVSGSDFESWEQCRRSTMKFLPKLIAEAVREGIEAGIFKIIDNRVVVCDIIEQNPR